jgi:hypothetical protein
VATPLHTGRQPAARAGVRNHSRLGETALDARQTTVDVAPFTQHFTAELIAYLQRKAKLAAPVPRVDLEPAELEALAGTYVQRDHDIEFERAFQIGTPAVVDVAGRDLRIRCADGRTRRAVPVGGGRLDAP